MIQRNRISLSLITVTTLAGLMSTVGCIDAFLDGFLNAGNDGPFAVGTYSGTVTKTYSRTPLGGTATTGSSSGAWSLTINSSGATVLNGTVITLNKTFVDPYGFTRTVSSITDTDTRRTIVYAVTGPDAATAFNFSGTITETLTYVGSTSMQFTATWNYTIANGTVEVDYDAGTLTKATE